MNGIQGIRTIDCHDPGGGVKGDTGQQVFGFQRIKLPVHFSVTWSSMLIFDRAEHFGFLQKLVFRIESGSGFGGQVGRYQQEQQKIRNPASFGENLLKSQKTWHSVVCLVAICTLDIY